ncbi:NnrS family protein [Thalassovita gelatinovora]|nr:NnrS family protein [Thalassovita gelatinovora]
MRAWTGPALLTYGFRPFFFGAGIWAALAMVLWVPMLSGHLELPSRFDPVSWHAHEFLYGYLGAVVAGFLLTSVPNWTGRLPIVGWPLGGLFVLWLAGRLAVAVSSGLPVWLVVCADLSMLVTLAVVLTREIVAGKNWRNLMVLVMLAVLILGNGVFHWEAAQGDYAAQGYGLRIGLAAGLMLIAVIGGRIVPSFTRNWLVRRGSGKLPVAPMKTFDKAALIVLLIALLFWIAAPENRATAFVMLLAGLLHLIRLSRWAGERCLSEPLLWVLHLGYGLLPLGAIMVALEALRPGGVGFAAAQHVWMAGTIGVMTLAVMTRATLGHTGQTLHAGPGTTMIYLCIIAAMLLRLAAGGWPMQADILLVLSGTVWIAAFGGFAVLYGRLLLRPLPRGA